MKNIIVKEDKLILLKEALNEFMVDKNSKVDSRDTIYFVLYRGDLLFFDEKNKKLLNDFFNRHLDDFGDFAYDYNHRKYYSDFDNLVAWVGLRVPYLLSGYISDGKYVYISKNEKYDILNSNELYQLIKKLPNCIFYVDYEQVDKDKVLGKKGQSMPSVWYSGTILERVINILTKGIRPMPEYSVYSIKHDKTVFMTSSFEQAEQYANFSSVKKGIVEKWGIKPCVLKIDASKIDENKIVYDYDLYNLHKVKKDDSAYNDRMKELGLSYDNKSYTVDNEDPRKFFKVGYRGIIMPSAIISVYLIDCDKKPIEIPRDEFLEYAMKLRDNVTENVELDKYEIGQETNTPSFGGNYFHVNNEIDEASNFDSSEIGVVNYSWDFDEEEYQEWLADAGYDNTQESLIEYVTNNVVFELEYLDNETYHNCGGETVDYNELEDMFGAKIQKEILDNCIKNGSGDFEIDNLYSSDDVDVNDPNTINDYAVKILKHGDYFKDCRGFILTNGVVVYTDSEHNEICRIPKVNSKFDFVRMGNIRVLKQSIDIGLEPTKEQREVLRQVISSYSDEELFLDLYVGNGCIGAHYVRPNWRYVMGEIDRFFSEGINPVGGGNVFESKEMNITENKDVISLAIENYGLTDTLWQAGYILPDGSLLNFGSDGERDTDHRSIEGIYKGNDIKIWNDEYRFNYVVDFMNHGAIRCCLNSGLLDMTREPSYEQYSVIKRFVMDAVDIDIDFTDDKGNTIHSVSYSDAKPQQVVADIDRFYNEGIRPQGNVRYESKKPTMNNLLEDIGDSVLKDENGNKIKMYHGTDSEFGEFDKDFIGRNGAHEGYGFNFTPIRSRAETYGSKNVIEAYLVLRNPMTTKSNGITVRKLSDVISTLDEGKPYTDTIVAAYEPPKYDEKWDGSYYKRALPIVAKKIYDYNLENEYGDAGIYADICLCGQSDKIETINAFEKLGYDGAIFYGANGNMSTVLVFEPNQIKRVNPTINENFDFEVDSSDIDLSSFKKKHELVPNIWNPDGKLNSRVRLKLMDIAHDFWDFVNLKWVNPSGVILTGSICNFNWSKYSDIDLHLIVDFKKIDEKTEFVRDYLDAKKNEWNNEHNALQIMGYQVELYVQDEGEEAESGGIYDLEENDWIKEPNPNDIKPIGLNKFYIKDKAAKIMTIIDDMLDAVSSTNDKQKAQEISDDADYLWEKIKNMRKESLEKDGESGSGNIIYKCIRRKGYLDKIWGLRTLCYDKVNSLGENKSNKKKLIKEYLEKYNNFPLYRYFKWAKTASSCEKAMDLAYECQYYIGHYIKEIYFRYQEFENLLDDEDEFDYEDEGNIEEFLKLLEENKLCDHFISRMQHIADVYSLPTWCTMDFNRIVKNEWCIHFTSDSESIAEYGFTDGTDEMERLAYTNAGQKKPAAGYNFAFLINDRSVDFNEYGDEAVIFRTSGVEAYHYGDNQNQVIFWGPNVKNFIPIHQENGEWVVYGQNGQILVAKDSPSEIAIWATENIPQYRKQILTGKNGYVPKYAVYDKNYKPTYITYPLYRNESVRKYLTLLKEYAINEEVVADGNSEHNPYKKRWDAERKALKDFISNYGKIMTSKENGKTYKVYYDKTLSELIGYNYCICLQWNMVTNEPKSVLYIRALDKFTNRIFQASFDTRGQDNQIGTSDDVKN